MLRRKVNPSTPGKKNPYVFDPCHPCMRGGPGREGNCPCDNGVICEYIGYERSPAIEIKEKIMTAVTYLPDGRVRCNNMIMGHMGQEFFFDSKEQYEAFKANEAPGMREWVE
jgi:hypothetical protein